MSIHGRFPFWYTLILSFCLLHTAPLYARSKSITNDFSGLYLCKGSNLAIGSYEVTVTLKKNKRNSRQQFAVYDLVTETENNVEYQGQAIANGNKLAITFKLSDAKNVLYSTGIAEFKKLASKRWQFVNHYYEPDDTGGNHGQEVCTMRQPALANYASQANSHRPR